MRKTLGLMMVVILITSIAVKAEVMQGDNEASIFYNFTDISGADTDNLHGVGISVGHFYTNELELGLVGSGGWSSDLDLYLLGANAKYHFMPECDLVPYLGGQINYVWAKGGDDPDGIGWGPLAGVKLFTDKLTSVFVEYQYQFFNDVSSSTDHANFILLGISRKF